MSVSGASSAVNNRLLTTTLDRYAKKIANNIARNDAIIAAFAQNSAIKVVQGGNRAVEILDAAENNNFAFRSMYSDIPIAKQDTRKTASYGWATIDGGIAINKIEEALNSGDSRIFDLAEAEITNAERTIIRLIAAALRSSSPADTDPESIITMIPDTATLSQTTTTGEISRTTNSFWRSQYDSTAMTLNATAGLQSLMGFYLTLCAKGPSKIEQPDLGLTTPTLFAALSAGHGDALRRFSPNDKMAALGFPNIQVLNATIIGDPSLPSGDLRFINTNYMFIQVARTPGMKDVGDRPQAFPVSVFPFQDAINSLHRVAIMSSTFALTASALDRHGIATSCS